MASEGPKSDASASAPEAPVVPTLVTPSVESIPPALAATAAPAADKPLFAKVPAPKKRPVVANPVATAPTPPAPVAAPTAPVISPPAPEPVLAPATTVIQKEAEVMETVQSATDTAQARAQTLFADANERTKSAMEKSAKMVEDMSAFSKGNIEALVESSKIAAKGIETMGQEAADYGRKQLESATLALKTLSSVKSPADFMKLHSDYMRNAFDAMVAETSKNTESMLKLAGEIAQPISNRVALAAEKIKVAA
jgi:hypothetical protein